MQWNNAGRLKKVTGVAQPGTYVYNGLGQRVKKSASTGAGQWANVRHFIYAEDRTSILGDYIQTVDQSGNASTLSVGSELVYLEGQPVPLLRNGQVYASMPDHLGTVRTIKDANGVVMWRWNSDAFGQSVPEEQPSGQATKFYYQFRFPGQYADGESGMTYNNARYYNPVNGRYYSSDPIGLAGGISTYSYVNGSPLTSVDRAGLWSTDAHNYFIDQFVETYMPEIKGQYGFIAQMKAGSAYADSSVFQASEFSYMHAMNSSALREKGQDYARQMTCNYTRAYGSEYARLNRSIYPAYRAKSYFYLGMALHAAMDDTSPAHEGFQTWDGIGSAAIHNYLLKHGGIDSSPASVESLRDAPKYLDKTLRSMKLVLDGQGCHCQ